MASDDFGWFLVFVGVVALAILTPLDLSLLANSYVLPVGLIIFGCLSILSGYLDIIYLSKSKDLLFAVFIVFLVRANLWFPLTVMPLSDVYSDSFNVSSMRLGCSVCDSSLLVGSDSFDVNFLYNADYGNITVSDSSVVLDQFSPATGAVLNASIPVNFSSLSFDSGVGNIRAVINGSADLFNLSLGVGSVDLGLSGDYSVDVDVGVGAVRVLVSEPVNSTLVINAGIGGIELFIPDGIDYVFDFKTGLGGVDNVFGSLESFSNKTSVLRVKAEAGIGGIVVNKV